MAPAWLCPLPDLPRLRGRAGWGRMQRAFVSSRLVVIGCSRRNHRRVLQSVEADRLEAARKQRGERIDVAADAAVAAAGRGFHHLDFAIRRKAQKQHDVSAGLVERVAWL